VAACGVGRDPGVCVSANLQAAPIHRRITSRCCGRAASRR
jgi:hypothetical protein